MAITANNFTGDNLTTNYSFTFEYLDQDEVKVTLNGVLTTDFTFANATTLSFNNAPGTGVNIRIFRDTDTDDLKATFFPGSAIKAEDLNNNFTQSNFVVQEIKNNTWDSDLETIKSIENWQSNDEQIATTGAIDQRHVAPVQDNEPTTGNFAGKFWYQDTNDKVLSVYNGTDWVNITSGGTFTRLTNVIYVDATNGDDANDGHRIITPKRTITNAVNSANAGDLIVVNPGVYQEACPIDVTVDNLSIVGTALRSVFVHPTSATEHTMFTEDANRDAVLFRLNSGSYVANMTLSGMKAQGSRGAHPIDDSATYGLPDRQGWLFGFYPGCNIKKSPYIHNCTNFCDSQIDNDNFDPQNLGGGGGGDLTSQSTGGGIIVDGSLPATSSPLRSIVCDSFTHVGLDGPGILVCNNGYLQATSSYAFFTHYHIKALSGGQANLAASTSDFGRFGLVAEGKSTTPIFTSTVNTLTPVGYSDLPINAPTAGADWFGSATRPQPNMLMEVDDTNGTSTYEIDFATEDGSGWNVRILRPDSADLSNNLGLEYEVAAGSAVRFYLRSQIASSGHTMEYVGSGTNYTALPENGGVPVQSSEVVEVDNGRIWTVTVDQEGTLRAGDSFIIDQKTGSVNFSAGAVNYTNFVSQTSETGCADIPTGTTAQRDAAPEIGYLRYNTDISLYEGWTGTSWASLSQSGLVPNTPAVVTNKTLSTNILYGSNSNIAWAGSEIAIANGTEITVGDNSQVQIISNYTI